MSDEVDLSGLGFAVTMMRDAPARIRYEKLKAENEALMEQSMNRGEQLLKLREQLDEARELLTLTAGYSPRRVWQLIDNWLEANK